MTEPETFRTTPGQQRELSDGQLRLELRPFAVARLDVASGEDED